MTITVIGSVLSPFVRKVRVLLEEKGVAYAQEDLNPFAPPEHFPNISPLKRIPVLKDLERGADWALPDSSAICAYLERRFPEPALFPAAAERLAWALWLEEYADTEFSHAIGQRVFRPALIEQLLSGAADRDAAARCVETELPLYFGYLEQQLGEAPWFLGEAFFIVDISVATHLQNLRYAGFAVDASRYPRLADFADRALLRPSFQTCAQQERALLSALGLSKESVDD